MNSAVCVLYSFLLKVRSGGGALPSACCAPAGLPGLKALLVPLSFLSHCQVADHELALFLDANRPDMVDVGLALFHDEYPEFRIP